MRSPERQCLEANAVCILFAVSDLTCFAVRGMFGIPTGNPKMVMPDQFMPKSDAARGIVAHGAGLTITTIITTTTGKPGASG